MIDYIVQNDISLSTSLDGPKEVHNYNRPFLGSEHGMYEAVNKRINYLKEHNIHIGAIQTTTSFNLDKSKKIIYEYVRQWIRSVGLLS